MSGGPDVPAWERRGSYLRCRVGPFHAWCGPLDAPPGATAGAWVVDISGTVLAAQLAAASGGPAPIDLERAAEWAMAWMQRHTLSFFGRRRRR